MLAYYKRTNSAPVLKKTESKRDVWVNLLQPTPGELHKVCDEFYLPYEDIHHILDKDEKAQIEIGEKHVLIVFQIPHAGKALPFSLILTRSAIITISLEQYGFLSTILERPPADFYTSKRTRATLHFYRLALKSFMRGLEQTEQRMEKLEASIMKGHRATDSLQNILKLQKQLIYFNTAIVSNEGILEKMLQEPAIPKYQSDQDVLNDLLLENTQAKAMISIYTQILSTLGETYSSLINNNVNHTMKILTSFTIIMTIPTVISSTYGMNIGLPLQSHPFAFLIVMAGTALLAVVAAVIFRFMRWL
ncbi:magnesium transporter CorA family protein [Candidatus Woesebacteria bacterium]|nr:magnesium transporter CorA family protein [Candidatus Woesebacteria bacterium]MCD8546390.1 magnesium transporter CorA family protein [Candidatus Woesebacteria bacterium]